MKIKILTTPGCFNCDIVKKMLDEIGIEYQVIDVTKNPECLQKYPIFTAPGIVINEQLEFIGIPSKKDLIQKVS